MIQNLKKLLAMSQRRKVTGLYEPVDMKGPIIKGRPKVELFDGLTGKKLEEIQSENFVALPMKEYLERIQQMVFFQGMLNTQRDGNTIHIMNRKMIPNINNKLNNIHLLENSNPEDPLNERDMRVNIIGWSSKGTYSGTDTKRGSFNENESSVFIDKIHYVFDWPTHSGNGTFQSIAWGDSYSAGTDLISEVFTPEMIVPQFISDNFGIHWDGQYWYTLSGGSTKQTVVRYDENFLNGETVFTLPSPISYWIDLHIENGIIFVMDYGGNVKKIDMATGTQLATVDVGGDNGYGSLQDSPQGLVLCHATNIKIISKVNLATIRSLSVPSGLYGIIAPYENDKFILTPLTGGTNLGKILNSDLTTNRELAFNLTDDYYIIAYNGSYPWGSTVKDGEVIINSYYRNLVKLIPNSLATRSLLPEPVTKTSTNTMKVTYDFLFQ